MTTARQYRILALVVAALLVTVLPILMLGPFLFNGVDWKLVTNEAVSISVVSAVVGVWLVAVCATASDDEIVKVIEPLSGAEAALLFLPYMFYVGTRAVVRRAYIRR